MLYFIMLAIIAVLLGRDLKNIFKVSYYERTLELHNIKDHVKGVSILDVLKL